MEPVTANSTSGSNSTDDSTAKVNDGFGDMIYIIAVMFFYLLVMAALLLSRFAAKDDKASSGEYGEGAPNWRRKDTQPNNRQELQKMTSMAMHVAAHQTIGFISGLTIDCNS